MTRVQTPIQTDPTPTTAGEGHAGHAARSPGLHTVTERGRPTPSQGALAHHYEIPVGFSGHGCSGAKVATIPRYLLAEGIAEATLCLSCGEVLSIRLAPHPGAPDAQMKLGEDA